MTQDINVSNQSELGDGKYLQASQQLQADKQTYGSDYIHLYVEDTEGDWLENWDWEDDLTEYIDAFYHHCENKNYQFALDTLMACDELLKQPENSQKYLELYSYLVEKIEEKATKQANKNNQEILNTARLRIKNLAENMQEEKIVNIIDPTGSRVGYIKKLLDKIHNGVIRKTWQFECHVSEDDNFTSFSKEGKANSGNFLVTFGIWYEFYMCGYFLSIQNGSEATEEIKEFSESPTFSVVERDLIEEYLKEIEAAYWQSKSVDLDALPE